MHILGFADGETPSAAVIAQQQVRAWVVESTPADHTGLKILDDALLAAGLSAEDIDAIVIAGRFSPPRMLRENRVLRRLALEPLSLLREGDAFLQGILRRTGLGAWESDVVAEAFENRLHGLGYRKAKVRLVDTHMALAEAAYRAQPADDVRIAVLHPHGDGVLASWFAGRIGQIDLVQAQVGAEAIATFLGRLPSLIGISPRAPWRLGWIAQQASPDPSLLEDLAHSLRVEDGKFTGKSKIAPFNPVIAKIRGLEVEVVAATLFYHLVEVISAWIAAQWRLDPAKRVLLAGSTLDDPRLRAAIAARLPEIDFGGTLGMSSGALGLGAAFSRAQPAPAHLSPYLGLGVDEVLPEGLTPKPGAVAQALAAGEVVLWWSGRDAPLPGGGGHRALLVAPSRLREVRETLGWPAVPAMALSTAEVAMDRLVAPAPEAREHFAAMPDGGARVWFASLEASDPLRSELQTLAPTGKSALTALAPMVGTGEPAQSATQALAIARRVGAKAWRIGAFEGECS